METTIIICIIGVLLLTIFTILKTPFRLIFKLVLNTATGFIMLFLINYVGSFVNISIGVNWLNAVIIGILGVPGVALILLLQWLSVI